MLAVHLGTLLQISLGLFYLAISKKPSGGLWDPPAVQRSQYGCPCQKSRQYTLVILSSLSLSIPLPPLTSKRRISPPRQDGRQAGWRHHQHEMPPVSDAVSQQSEQHVPHTPGKADDSARERAVFCIYPLDTCVRTNSWLDSVLLACRLHGKHGETNISQI